MKLKFEEGLIEFNRELSDLDKFVIKFIKILERNNIKYIVLSGYIAILFGRTRGTEDVDVFIEKLDENKFSDLVGKLYKNNFYCLNTDSKKEMLSMLNDNLSIRFAISEKVTPNIEIKFPKDKEDEDSLKNSIKVKLNEFTFKTSSIETQIVYKLHLGSQKDIEDSIHLYNLFKDYLNKEKLETYGKKLNVLKLMEKYNIKHG